jgi:hypothetical protein
MAQEETSLESLLSLLASSSLDATQRSKHTGLLEEALEKIKLDDGFNLASLPGTSDTVWPSLV